MCEFGGVFRGGRKCKRLILFLVLLGLGGSNFRFLEDKKRDRQIKK